MVEKTVVDSTSKWLLMHPRHTILVTCVDGEGRPNIITLAWSMVTSHDPFMVAISVAPQRYSHDLIKNQKEFCVNVPTMDIVKETLYCGRNSGRDVDKFQNTGLTPIPAENIKPPHIKECIAHLECRVVGEMITGDHTILVGEVVRALVNDGIFDKGFDTKKIKPILHNGYDDFLTIDPRVTTPSRKWKFK